MTADQYAQAMKLLLPPGPLWRLEADSVLSKVLLGTADELVRVETRALDLIRESDPRQADELLPDYERALGLDSTGTLDERRARVVARLIARQRYRPDDFRQALAPLLGQDVADVVVIETSRADAIATGDDRDIFRAHIYRDPNEPGTYDLVAAQELCDAIKPAHTEVKVIESIDFICDDPFSLCDRDLLGV